MVLACRQSCTRYRLARAVSTRASTVGTALSFHELPRRGWPGALTPLAPVRVTAVEEARMTRRGDAAMGVFLSLVMSLADRSIFQNTLSMVDP
jgi:hypothetical protein